MLLPGGWLIAMVALEELAADVADGAVADVEFVALGVEPLAAGAALAAGVGEADALAAGDEPLAAPAAAEGEANPENAVATSEEDK
jgi:hypothetical protein